jgi:hypothetical protein
LASGEFVLLKEDGTFEVATRVPAEARGLVQEEEAGRPASRSQTLKHLLLAFFAGGEERQRDLIPAIADAAGFSAEQRAAAVRRIQGRSWWSW